MTRVTWRCQEGALQPFRETILRRGRSGRYRGGLRAPRRFAGRGKQHAPSLGSPGSRSPSPHVAKPTGASPRGRGTSRRLRPERRAAFEFLLRRREAARAGHERASHDSPLGHASRTRKRTARCGRAREGGLLGLLACQSLPAKVDRSRGVLARRCHLLQKSMGERPGPGKRISGFSRSREVRERGPSRSRADVPRVRACGSRRSMVSERASGAEP